MFDRKIRCHTFLHLSVEFYLDFWPAARERDLVTDSSEKSIQRRIYELQIEHRDLDEVVNRLSEAFDVDQLMIRRLKLRKLRLKDQISRLKSELIPDLDA